MRVWRVNDSSASDPLIFGEIPQPVARTGEVLIRVHDAGVTPTELSWYPTTHTKTGEKRTGAVPGHEFSGTIADVCAGVSGFSVGQEIFGMNDWFADGATAEYCITRPEWIAAKPNRLTHTEAASVPIGALTAWQGLFDRAKLQTGERVLIHGGSGAVGVYAVQFATRHGAHVTTTASARNERSLLELGSERVIDYQNDRFEDIVSEIDVVFDCVGGATLHRSWGVLKPNGRLVTIAADSEGTTDVRTKNAFFIVEARRDQLITIGKLLDSGDIRPVVDSVVPFAQAGAAYARQIQKRAGCGKVVIAVADGS